MTELKLKIINLKLRKMSTIKKEHAKDLKKGQTFQSEDGYCHVFEEFGTFGVITDDGNIVDYYEEESTMYITFTLEAEMLEAIKAFYGENTTDEMIKEEINLIFKEKKLEVYKFITENLTEMI